MASGKDLADAISKSVEKLCQLYSTIKRIWDMPAEEDRYKQNASYLLALPEALTKASDFTNSLARCHELATALYANWAIANRRGRVVVGVGLAISLAQSPVPHLVSRILNYIIQRNLEKDFRGLWGSSSLESKVTMIFFLVWLLFYATLHYLRRVRQEER